MNVNEVLLKKAATELNKLQRQLLQSKVFAVNQITYILTNTSPEMCGW